MGARPVQLDVLFADGREERVSLSMRALIAVEDRWPPGPVVDDDGKVQLRTMPPRRANAWALWITLENPTVTAGPSADAAFEAFIPTLVSFADPPEDEAEADPTQPAAGDAE